MEDVLEACMCPGEFSSASALNAPQLVIVCRLYIPETCNEDHGFVAYITANTSVTHTAILPLGAVVAKASGIFFIPTREESEAFRGSGECQLSAAA